MFELNELFRFRSTLAEKILGSRGSIWQVVASLREITEDLVGSRRTINGSIMPGAHIYEGPVYIGSGAIIEPGACIMGKAYIGAGAVVRHGAYVRGDCVLLEGSLLGHASEAKSSLFLEGAKAPHFAYVGDSILGSSVNLGAGTKLSNVKINRRIGDSIGIPLDGHIYDTGLTKLGAILGDDVQIGCNAVTNPGCIIGARTMVYPNATVRAGYYGPDQIIKINQGTTIVARQGSQT